MSTVSLPPAFDPAPAGARANRVWLLAATLALLVHITLSVMFPDRPWTTSVGTGSVILVALGIALRGAMSASGMIRLRWWLLIAGLLLWLLGYMLIAYQQMSGAGADGPLSPMLMFSLRGAPWFLAIAYTSDRKVLPHTSAFDSAQIVIFVCTAAFLFYPYLLPGLVESAPNPATMLRAEKFYDAELAFLSLTALAYMHFQPTVGERAFSRILAVLLASYCVLAFTTNHFIIDRLDPPPGSWMLLIGDMPPLLFVAAVCWMATDLGDRSALPPSIVRQCAILLVPALIPICVVLMALAIAPIDTVIASVLAVAAMLTYTGRSVLTQIAHTRARAELQQARDAMASLARRDELTGLANRRHFDHLLREQWAQAQHHSTALGALFIDIDHFKDYNDALGHVAGDACLRRIAEVLRHAGLRASDVVARYGGEEFVVLTGHAEAQSVARAAERIRAAVERAAIPHPISPHAVVSVSVGSACGVPGKDWQEPKGLLADADAALYIAKRSGRNRVVASSSEAGTA